MRSEEYTGNSAALKGDCPWLASEDILGAGDVTVTIEACYAVKAAEFEGGRKEDVYTLGFVGKKKQLVLNSINRKTLVKLYGTNVSEWKGKPITLWVDRNVRAFGEIRNGIRIRPTAPKVKAKQTEQSKPDPFGFESLIEQIDTASTLAEVEQIDSKSRAAELTAVQLKQLSEKIEIARVALADSEV